MEIFNTGFPITNELCIPWNIEYRNLHLIGDPKFNNWKRWETIDDKVIEIIHTSVIWGKLEIKELPSLLSLRTTYTNLIENEHISKVDYHFHDEKSLINEMNNYFGEYYIEMSNLQERGQNAIETLSWKKELGSHIYIYFKLDKTLSVFFTDASI